MTGFFFFPSRCFEIFPGVLCVCPQVPHFSLCCYCCYWHC